MVKPTSKNKKVAATTNAVKSVKVASKPVKKVAVKQAVKTPAKVASKPAAKAAVKTTSKSVKSVKTNTKSVVTKKVAPKKAVKAPVKNKKLNSSKFVLILSILLLIAAGVLIGIKKFVVKKNVKTTVFSLVSKDGVQKVDLNLMVADSDPVRLKGLMGVKKLAPKSGMIFDFEEPGYYSMWMKNMKIPLDMVFLNNYGKVIVLAPNRPANNEDLITPCSIELEGMKARNKKLKLNEDKFFDKCEEKYLKYPNLTRYVLELPAGTIKNHNMMLGDVLLRK